MKYPDLQWSHEQGSIEMFKDMIDKNHIDTFDSSDMKQIEALILGDISIGKCNLKFIHIASVEDPFDCTSQGKNWMYEIGKLKL